MMRKDVQQHIERIPRFKRYTRSAKLADTIANGTQKTTINKEIPSEMETKMKKYNGYMQLDPSNNPVEYNTHVVTDFKVEIKYENEIDKKFEPDLPLSLLSEPLNDDIDQTSSGNISTDSEVSSEKSDKRFQCSECNEYFKSKVLLALHLKIHYNRNGNKCIYCEDVIIPSKRAKETDITCVACKFICTFCSKTFGNSGNLNYHTRMHTGERSFVCKHCDKKFVNASNLEQHIRIHIKEKQFKCKRCKQEFATANKLQRHIRTHTKVSSHKCTECGKSFKYLSAWKRHKSIHNDDNPFKCTKCNKSFQYPSALKRHESIHNDDNPFKCTKCVKKFKDSSHLLRHIRTHIGDKSYPCTRCDKMFVEKASLTNHMLMHNGVREHRCFICDMDFTQKVTLIKHFQTHPKYYLAEDSIGA